MTLRSEIEFGSAFPDDSVFEEEAGYVQWPGRNITQVLKVGLEARGYRASDPVDLQEKGWELDIWRGSKRLWLRISVLDTEVNYITTKDMSSFLFRDKVLFPTFLSDLQAVLEADDRFIRIGWLPAGGIKRGVPPAARPFDD